MSSSRSRSDPQGKGRVSHGRGRGCGSLYLSDGSVADVTQSMAFPYLNNYLNFIEPFI